MLRSLIFICLLITFVLADDTNTSSTMEIPTISPTIDPSGMTVINVTSVVPTATVEVPATTTIQCDTNIDPVCIPLVTVETSTTSIFGSTFYTNVSTALESLMNSIVNGTGPESSTSSLKERLSTQIVATILSVSIALAILVI